MSSEDKKIQAHPLEKNDVSIKKQSTPEMQPRPRRQGRKNLRPILLL